MDAEGGGGGHGGTGERHEARKKTSGTRARRTRHSRRKQGLPRAKGASGPPAAAGCAESGQPAGGVAELGQPVEDGAGAEAAAMEGTQVVLQQCLSPTVYPRAAVTPSTFLHRQSEPGQPAEDLAGTEAAALEETAHVVSQQGLSPKVYLPAFETPSTAPHWQPDPASAAARELENVDIVHSRHNEPEQPTKPNSCFWLLFLTAGAFIAFLILIVVALTSDDELEFARVMELLGYLISLNFLSSAIVFVIFRRLLLKYWAGFSDQDLCDVDGDRAHLPATWLRDLRARPNVGFKIKLIDAFSRKGGHIYGNVMNYVVISGYLADGDTTQLMVAGISGVTLLAVARAMVVAFMPAERWPKTWYAWTLLFGGSNRVRDGHWAIINLLTAGVAGNLGLICLYGIAMLALPPEKEAEELWRFAINLATMPLIFGDALGEIIGTPLGRYTFKVAGFGEINKKSVEGCIAVFLGTLVPTLVVTLTGDVGPDGRGATTTTKAVVPLLLAVVVTLVETLSFRSTDNFTIPVSAGAVIVPYYILAGKSF